MVILRRISIRILLPPIWKFSRTKTAEALLKFSVTEVDSAWQNLYALNHSITDPSLRAKMFQHVLEELHHATLFRDAVHKYANNLLPMPMSERLPLFQRGNEYEALIRFFGREYIGEEDVGHQFGDYLRACPYPDIEEIFARLEKDEIGHTNYTRQVFYELIPSKLQRMFLIARIRFRLFYEAWCRIGILVGGFASNILLGSVYFFFGGIAQSRKTVGLREKDSYRKGFFSL